MTPLDTLYYHAKELKERGHKTISVEFIISKLDEHYAEVSKRHVGAS